jgi:hypothetical protein
MRSPVGEGRVTTDRGLFDRYAKFGKFEFSGFGKQTSYEEGCQAMFRAGLRWLDDYPKFRPEAHTFSGVYGILVEDNVATKALSDHITSDPYVEKNGGATGAMHQAVMSCLLFIARKGFETWTEEVRKARKFDGGWWC